MSQQEKKAVVTDGSDVPEESKKVAGETQQDPKNVGELTHYIQNMLQQMQDRSGWNLPSHQLIPLRVCRFQTMSDQIISRIDDMSSRIDDLEHNINDLMSQAGQGGPSNMIEKDKWDIDRLENTNTPNYIQIV